MNTGIKFKSGPPPDRSSDQCADRQALRDRYKKVRELSSMLTAPLHAEDHAIQSMPDVSPTKWHLAHTTWFFETFILKKFMSDYSVYDEKYAFLFNSYYYTVGEMHARPRRGLLSRPTVEEVWSYRYYVDEAMDWLLDTVSGDLWQEVFMLTEVGLNHEQQHQELILTDIKHVMSCNALFPDVYPARPVIQADRLPPLEYISFDGGLIEMGHDDTSFCFDNETPVHEELVRPFALGSRLVTNGEYLEFMEDGGYGEVALWLSDAWAELLASGRSAPVYWHRRDGEWWEFTLGGLVPLQRSKPVCHVSFFEAQAFATWSGKRLPTEFELETVLKRQDPGGNLLRFPQGGGQLTAPEPRPLSADSTGEGPFQLYGDVWEWTQSSYAPYPGFEPLEGSLGEYNGKFMCNQYVLRGGSSATPADHIRPTYRNFFPAAATWQFSGIRLADDQ